MYFISLGRSKVLSAMIRDYVCYKSGEFDTIQTFYNVMNIDTGKVLPLHAKKELTVDDILNIEHEEREKYLIRDYVRKPLICDYGDAVVYYEYKDVLIWNKGKAYLKRDSRSTVLSCTSLIHYDMNSLIYYTRRSELDFVYLFNTVPMSKKEFLRNIALR